MLSHLRHLHRLLRHKLRDLSHGVPRSPHWPTVEHHFRADNPTCAACGGSKNLQVHHLKPFHLAPDLELEPTNLIGLCMAHGCDAHLLIGHGDNFKCYVPDVKERAAKAFVARKAGEMDKVKIVEQCAKDARKLDLS